MAEENQYKNESATDSMEIQPDVLLGRYMQYLEHRENSVNRNIRYIVALQILMMFSWLLTFSFRNSAVEWLVWLALILIPGLGVFTAIAFNMLIIQDSNRVRQIRSGLDEFIQNSVNSGKTGGKGFNIGLMADINYVNRIVTGWCVSMTLIWITIVALMVMSGVFISSKSTPYF